jgi:hypothetical protein
MKMANGWTVVAESGKGAEFGHVPGHEYHDVDVAVGKRGDKFRVVVLETWGSAQGRDEEHGRNKVVAIDVALDVAVRIASARAQQAGIKMEYAVQALSCAHSDAVDDEAQQAEKNEGGTDMYQPRTGQRCGCRPGIQRDNCQRCEGTGWVIDFRAIRAARSAPASMTDTRPNTMTDTRGDA